MRSSSARLLVVAVGFTILAAACTPTGGGSDGPPADPADTTTTTSVAPTTSTEPPRDEQGNLLPPERADPAAVAEAVLVPLDGFEPIEEPPQHALDLVHAMEMWVPEEFVAATFSEIYDNASGAPVAAISVVPSLSLRGDPNLVPSLIKALTGFSPPDPRNGIYTAVALSGIEMQLWSTGDGFVIAAAPDDESAFTYLEALQEVTGPNDVWAAGTCLYLEDDENLPYAPFPPDVVVPCAGAHNAEVLYGEKVGTDLEAFDADAIAYERSYVCDEVYTATFGSQLDAAPTLITYMPDEDEWDRGDRYLACVVMIERNDGRELIAGPMQDHEDVAWAPEVGDCLLIGIPADTVGCSVRHAYQFLGDVEVVADSWPKPGDTVFADACRPLLDGLEPGPAEIDVLPYGLGAYSFEQGERTVRCLAYAVEDGFLVDTIGSFHERWRVARSGGIAA